jgi:LacI family transcriptional regulator
MYKKDPPTAIITGGSIIAKGVFLYCRENNLIIPDDISVISFGDFPFGGLVCPRLTYVGDEYEKIGDGLVKLIRQVFNGKLNNIETVIEPQLCLHDSVMEMKKENYYLK